MSSLSCAESSVNNRDESYDTGIDFPNDLDREAHFRLGFMSSAMGVRTRAEQSRTTSQLVVDLRLDEEDARHARMKASTRALRAAAKRAGRKSYRVKFNETENCESRLLRGKNHAIASALYAVQWLIKRPKPPTMEDVRKLISVWCELIIEWACTTDENDRRHCCAPCLANKVLYGKWGVDR